MAALRAAARDAASRWRFDRLVLFGSFAHGGIHERSDVDLAVWGLDPSDETALWAHFADATHRSVDLVRVEEAPAALRARIEHEGTDLGAAS